jgi:polyribonucleotide nucleotidyltransferase
LKYCIKEIKIIIEKIKNLIIEENEEKKIEENILCVNENEDKMWANKCFDFETKKRTRKAISLIREISRDISSIKFSSGQLFHVQKFLEFLEIVEEKLFFDSFVIV